MVRKYNFYELKDHIFLVSFKDVQNVPFPAVTVCAPNAGKWQVLVEALDYFDKDELIFETVSSLSLFKDSFIPDVHSTNRLNWDILLKQFEPSLKLDQSLLTRLNLLPIEKEVFYLLHFACYVASYECGDKVIIPYSKFTLSLVLHKNTRYQTAQEICYDLVKYSSHHLIDYEEVDCQQVILNENDT